jgi:hypothetical protein
MSSFEEDIPMRRPIDFYLPEAELPPRFVAAWFSDEAAGVRIAAETIRNWREAGYFGPRAAGPGRIRLTWNELLAACKSWSPSGSFAEMQRKPYPSEIVAVRLGLSHAAVLERFRARRIAGGFKIGSYWYARAAEFDAAQALRRQ